ncbi:hypothetical protein DL770_009467 [Monosporascus sp. CRB-9-2]|nr:hypothetical protein DL770_009467 [Monosporascus sp. CRB-9-2]
MEAASSQEVSIQYWKTFLQGFKPSHFPTLSDGAPTTEGTFQETTVKLDVNNATIAELCSQHHITVGSLIQTAWAIVIACYAGVEDVCFAYSSDDVPPSISPNAELGALLCRVRVTTEQQLFQTIAEVMKNFDSALCHRNCSIADIMELVELKGQPLFDSELRVEQSRAPGQDGSPTSLQKCWDWKLKDTDIAAIVLMRDDGHMEASVRTHTSKFSAAHTENVAHTFGKTLLACVEAHEQCIIRDLDLFSRHDYKQVAAWNKASPQAVEACFHHYVEAIAQKSPDASAICSWDRNFSYRELDALATKLASHLVSLGVIQETLVLICFDKSSIALVSMLAIFKAGGAFVAIDPSYPTSRIQAITEATNAPIVLAEPAHCHLFEGIVELIVPLDSQSADELPTSYTVTRPTVSPSNTAYVVFTSGSTGAPKGIMVEHRALCTAAQSLAAPMRVSSRTRFLQFAAYTFDLSYGDIFVTLSQGGCICVPSENERVNDLAGAIVRMNANTACLIPSVARMIQPADVPSLETLLLGGEALLRETLELWAGKVFIAQMYGPSEATVWCTSKEDLKADSAVNNIGRGLAVRLWITSSSNHNRLCPIGCIGELLIEGPVLARGYLNAHQTQASFIENPIWAEAVPGQRRRFYKTGDLARYNMDGTVSFIGRKDTQVKFHGRRIEMGEIEYHLSTHPLLRQSVVTLPTAGIYSKRLVAVLVLKTGKPPTETASVLKAVRGHASEVAQIKGYLSPRLPFYMLPQSWVVVEDIPLMISGKMNRVSVKKFVESLTDEDNPEETIDRKPVNGLGARPNLDELYELHLRQILGRILDKCVGDIGVEQSFDSLGGDSFSAMELVAACKAEGLALTVQEVLSSSTIRQMVPLIKMRKGHAAEKVCRADESSYVRKVLRFAPVWWDARPELASAGV